MLDPDASRSARFTEPTDEICPLCQKTGPRDLIPGADDRDYRLCSNCQLIAAHPDSFPSRHDEASHYRLHENSITNAGYVDFLARAIEPVRPLLSVGMRCLDFGCGPGPTLSQLVREIGCACEDYDPLFRDVPLVPPYDVIFATECVEHFHHPAREFARLARLLRPRGYLVVMTETWTELTRFGQWYYTRDPTHVSFFHARTFDVLCRRYDWQSIPTNDHRVFLFRSSRSLQK